MHRVFFEAIIKNSVTAAALYQKAFDAELVAEHKNEDGSYAHAELSINGHILALMELRDEIVIGNTMMFALEFGTGNEDCVQKAYEILKDDATIIDALGPCPYSQLQFVLIDKFGVRWCLFA
ncbi:MAG: VOC family protein [Oscillospiraceae bacterium]|nr:VOC family protein [Oscillospiraceae bacterium]